MGQGRPAAAKPLRPLPVSGSKMSLTASQPPQVAVTLDRKRLADATRLRIAGLRVSSDCGRIQGAVVAAEAGGLESSVDLLVSGSAELTDDVPALFRRLRSSGAVRAAEHATLAKHVANAAAELINAMLAEANLPADGILAIGVVDPGLWFFEPGAAAGYECICDAAWLAERTGLNCIDAFAKRDLAGGGQGGPLLALPYWMLFRSPQKTRLLLDLGRTTRLTYLPPAALPRAAGSILSFDVGPGTVLTDRLARQLTNGQYPYDPGGSLAVQGRKIPDLIDHWLSAPYFQEPPPRWYPLGVKPEAELNESIRMAVASGWSVRDLLCTATHFIAESVALAIERHVPRDPPIDEVLLSGGGQANGMLLREIASRVADKGGYQPIYTRCAGMGYSDDVLEGVCAALLALLHLEQVPANHPGTTGAQTPRVLGRLTPGSPQSWRRLVQHLATSLPQTMSLRNAI